MKQGRHSANLAGGVIRRQLASALWEDIKRISGMGKNSDHRCRSDEQIHAFRDRRKSTQCAHFLEAVQVLRRQDA